MGSLESVATMTFEFRRCELCAHPPGPGVALSWWASTCVPGKYPLMTIDRAMVSIASSPSPTRTRGAVASWSAQEARVELHRECGEARHLA